MILDWSLISQPSPAVPKPFGAVTHPPTPAGGDMLLPLARLRRPLPASTLLY